MDGNYELIHTIEAHSKPIFNVALSNSASMLATVCNGENKVRLWDVKQGLYAPLFVEILVLMNSGTMLDDTQFKSPTAALFFNRSPSKLVVACSDDIFIVDVSPQSTKPFSNTPGVWYSQHALTLSDDDAMLVAFNSNSVCGYDIVSLTQLWVHNTDDSVDAACMLSAHVLVTVRFRPTLVLGLNTGALIAELHKAGGFIRGLGVIQGLCFIVS